MDMNAIHWMSTIIQKMDQGLVIIDREYHVEVWNEFMESFSGVLGHTVRGKSIFKVFPELDKPWLRVHIDTAFNNDMRFFIPWQQHPHLFDLTNYKPFTGGCACMYQNITLLPIKSLNGQINQLTFLVDDATEEALLTQS